MAFVAFNSFQRMAASKKRAAAGGGGGGGLPTLFYPFQFYIKNYATGVGVSDATASNVTISNAKSYKVSAPGSLYNSSGATTANYYVQLSNITLPSPTVGFTVCFWANFSVNTNQFLFQFYQSNSYRLMLYYYGGVFSDIIGINYPYAISTNVWYHIVYLSSSTGTKLYINGGPNGNGTTPNASSAGTYTSYTTVNNLIGCAFYNGVYSNGFSGYMNNYYYYPRVLSSAEINTIYTE